MTSHASHGQGRGGLVLVVEVVPAMGAALVVLRLGVVPDVGNAIGVDDAVVNPRLWVAVRLPKGVVYPWVVCSSHVLLLSDLSITADLV
jgi:hypothetical protein